MQSIRTFVALVFAGSTGFICTSLVKVDGTLDMILGGATVVAADALSIAPRRLGSRTQG
jgi:hypothetical protein